MTVTHEQPRGARPPVRRSLGMTAWVLQVALALLILGAGIAKLTSDRAMVEMFDDIGAGQWMRVLVGLLEVAGGIGLLLPRLRAVAALGLLLLLLGATITNLAVLETNTTLSVLLSVVALGILVLRRRELPTRSSA